MAKVFGIFTEDGLDQTVYSLQSAKREAKDLRGMGCKVTVVQIEASHGPDLDDALDAIHEGVREGKRIGGFWLNRLAIALGMTLTLTKV